MVAVFNENPGFTASPRPNRFARRSAQRDRCCSRAAARRCGGRPARTRIKELRCHPIGINRADPAMPGPNPKRLPSLSAFFDKRPGECSYIVDSLLSFGCRVDEDPGVFQSYCFSAIGNVRHESACGEAPLDDMDWFNSADAISRLKASRVQTSYLSRQSRMTSGSTRAQAAAFTRRASCSVSPSSLNSPDALASVRIFAMRRTTHAL